MTKMTMYDQAKGQLTVLPCVILTEMQFYL